MDFRDPAQLQRLYDAVGWSRLRLEPFRVKRLEALKEFVGLNYSTSGSDDKVPINLLQIAIGIFLRLLVSRNPRTAVTTRFKQLRSMADDMEQWANWRIEEMNLADTLRLVVQDAMFSIGIAKVGLTAGTHIEWEGQTHMIGEPFVDHIDLDDWVHDISAKRFEQCAFMGHRYRMPLEEAKAFPQFDPEVRSKLTGSQPSFLNEVGDTRTTALSQDALSSYLNEYTDYVELWELYLPREKKIVTCVYEPGRSAIAGPPLRVADWVGPNTGPYYILSFVDVPNNTMPSAPVHHMMDLHSLFNRITRKLGRQSDRQKTVLAAATTAARDANKVRESSDGDIIDVAHPDQLKEYRFGGIDQPQLAFLIQLKQLFSWSQGNLETIGGLSAQAGTLGQEELLQQQSSAQIKDMQERVIRWVREVGRALFWYWFNDNLANYETSKTLPGTEFSIPKTITPQQRQGNFQKLNFDIRPYSLQAKTPQQLAQQIMQTLMQVLLPAGAMLQQQGIGIDWQSTLHLLGKYNDMPDLEQILTFAQPLDQQQPADEPPHMPTTTNRNYTRRSVPGVQGAGRDQAMIETLMGGAQPNVQRQAMGA